MELAVILVLAVIVELALTFYLLGRLRDFRATVNELVDHMANVEHGLDGALASIGQATQRLDNDVQTQKTLPDQGVLQAATQVAKTATPDELEQAKTILAALGVNLED